MAVEIEKKIDHAEEQRLELEDDLVPRDDDPRIKAIKRKTDLRICTLLGVLYMMAAIDRVNLPVCSTTLTVLHQYFADLFDKNA